MEGRTDERERRNGTDELQFSRLLAPRRTTCFTRRALDGRAEDGITSQVWEAAAVRSLARRFIPTLPPEPFVCFRISKRVRRPRVCPRPSRQPLNFIFFRSPAPDAHDRSLTCLLEREGIENQSPPPLPFLPPSAAYLPILWSHYSER